MFKIVILTSFLFYKYFYFQKMYKDILKYTREISSSSNLVLDDIF